MNILHLTDEQLTLVQTALDFYTEEGFNRRTQPIKEILNKINRVEYIDSEGRQLVKYGKHSFDIQDDGQTLKIFKEGKV